MTRVVAVKDGRADQRRFQREFSQPLLLLNEGDLQNRSEGGL